MLVVCMNPFMMQPHCAAWRDGTAQTQSKRDTTQQNHLRDIRISYVAAALLNRYHPQWVRMQFTFTKTLHRQIVYA